MPANLQVEVRNDRITLYANNVTLHALLAEIARQGELEVLLQDPLHEHVTFAIFDQPLPAAIGRILQNHSFALHYVSGQRGVRDTPPNRLWVFASEAKEIASDNQPTLIRVAGSEADPGAGLTFALANENVDARLDALAAFAPREDDAIPPALTSAALLDPNPAVRTAALDVLGELGSQQTLSSLEQALYDHSAAVREAAVSALADIGGAAAIPALSTALSSHDPQVREQAVDALGEIGTDAAAGLLRQALNDEEQSVREAAADYIYEER